MMAGPIRFAGNSLENGLARLRVEGDSVSPGSGFGREADEGGPDPISKSCGGQCPGVVSVAPPRVAQNNVLEAA